MQQGLTFEAHRVGDVHRTLARTLSETDIVTFVNLCGFNEPLFMDMEYVARESVFKREAPQYRILHLAAHGILDDRSPM